MRFYTWGLPLNTLPELHLFLCIERPKSNSLCPWKFPAWKNRSRWFCTHTGFMQMHFDPHVNTKRKSGKTHCFYFSIFRKVWGNATKTSSLGVGNSNFSHCTMYCSHRFLQRWAVARAVPYFP